MHGRNLFPFFRLQHVFKATIIPFVFLVNASNNVDALVVINQTIGWVPGCNQIPELKNFRRTASENQMGVNNCIVFCASNYMYIAVWNYNSLRIVRQVLKLLKLLDFIVLVLDVVQKAVILLYREDRKPCN